MAFKDIFIKNFFDETCQLLTEPHSTWKSIEGPLFRDSFNYGKLATEQRKCPNFICRQNTVQNGQNLDTGKVDCQALLRQSKSFIIPTSQKFVRYTGPEG